MARFTSSVQRQDDIPVPAGAAGHPLRQAPTSWTDSPACRVPYGRHRSAMAIWSRTVLPRASLRRRALLGRIITQWVDAIWPEHGPSAKLDDLGVWRTRLRRWKTRFIGSHRRTTTSAGCSPVRWPISAQNSDDEVERVGPRSNSAPDCGSLESFTTPLRLPGLIVRPRLLRACIARLIHPDRAYRLSTLRTFPHGCLRITRADLPTRLQRLNYLFHNPSPARPARWRCK